MMASIIPCVHILQIDLSLPLCLLWIENDNNGGMQMLDRMNLSIGTQLHLLDNVQTFLIHL